MESFLLILIFFTYPSLRTSMWQNNGDIFMRRKLQMQNWMPFWMEPFIGENIMHIFMLNAYRMRWSHIPITKIKHYGYNEKCYLIICFLYFCTPKSEQNWKDFEYDWFHIWHIFVTKILISSHYKKKCCICSKHT